MKEIFRIPRAFFTEANSEPCQTSKMEQFSKTVNRISFCRWNLKETVTDEQIQVNNDRALRIASFVFPEFR